jgi:hypothetical protein
MSKRTPEVQLRGFSFELIEFELVFQAFKEF